MDAADKIVAFSMDPKLLKLMFKKCLKESLAVANSKPEGVEEEEIV